MIDSSRIQNILQKSEAEKSSILEKILTSIQEVDSVFEAKKASSEELMEQSDKKGEDVVRILNGHIRRLETEKAELNMEIQELKESFSAIDEVKEQITTLHGELENTRAVAERALKEKADAEQKLVKIQEQWEKFSMGR